MVQDSSAPAPNAARTVTLNLRNRRDEQGENMLWFASWIVDGAGAEGEWFYSGTNSDASRYDVPEQATGVRIRRWPSPGTDPEYVDLPVNADGEQTITDRGLQFDRRQPNSLLHFDD